MMVQRNLCNVQIMAKAESLCIVGICIGLMPDSAALGSMWGQSRCHLYADKAAAIGAEMIAIHARGLFLHSLDNTKQ